MVGSREPTPTWSFAVVLVRQGRRFLLVHERKHGQLWYLPAGRVEPGESWAQGALREALEETGVPVVLEGVLEIQHTPRLDSARVRVIFVARPADDTPPKSQPDEESLEAGWFSLEEAAQLPLRGGGQEVLSLMGRVLDGAPVYPLSLIASESS